MASDAIEDTVLVGFCIIIAMFKFIWRLYLCQMNQNLALNNIIPYITINIDCG